MTTKLQKWRTLYHNGVYFPEEYISLPNNVYFRLNKKKLNFTPSEEEPLLLYTKMLDSEYKENKTFHKNFFKDWMKLLRPENQLLFKTIDDLKSIDFSIINDYLVKLKEDKKNITKEQKAELKKEKEQILEKYKYCFIDGIKQPVHNFIIEPPGLFKGRGNHPKIGKIKPRIRPEDVTLNLSLDASVPKPNINGNWQDIIENKLVIWIASWKDIINNVTKYVYPAETSDQRKENDKKKYDIARKLKKKINTIRHSYNKYIEYVNLIEDVRDSYLEEIEIGVCTYLVDHLALRVGNEKSDDSADTVGVTSLRIEHISLPSNNVVKLDFLGKDSIRYNKVFEVEENVWKALEYLVKNKQKKDNLFSKVTPDILNDYLRSFLKGLTAKVFRTFNASYLLSKRLKESKVQEYINNKKNKNIEKSQILLNYLMYCFVEIATICNHRKKESKSINNVINQLKSLKKQKSKVSQKSNKKEKLVQKINILKTKKELKLETKSLNLGTSKSNYIDPRLVLSYLKKYDISFESVYTKKLLDKFNWALTEINNFKY